MRCRWSISCPPPHSAPADPAAGRHLPARRGARGAWLVHGQERSRRPYRGQPIPPDRASRPGPGHLCSTLWIALGLLAKSPSPPAGEREGPTPRRARGGGCRSDSATAESPTSPQPLRPRGRSGSGWRWRRAGEALIALVALTITAGGFVAGLNAGLTYNTFPLMDGQLCAGRLRAVTAVCPQLVRECRRRCSSTIGCWPKPRAAAVLLLWLAGRRAACRAPPGLRCMRSLAAALLQFALGVSTLLLVVPVPLAAAHQAGAVLLLTAAIVFRHRLA